MSLYKAESRRLIKRRFVRYLALAGLLVLAAVVVGTFFTNEKVGPAQIAAAEQQAERDYQQAITDAQQARVRCAAAKASGAPNTGEFPDDCSQISDPSRESYRAEWNLPATFNFRESFGGTLTAFAAVMALVAFVAGASFVGAEWSSGGMMNLLLWRPQRVKVLATKLVAFLVGLTVLSVVTGALWTVAFWVIGSLRGTTEKMTPGAWQSFGLTGLRAFALIVAAGVIGFGLASLGRHTAMALGVAIGFGVVVQFGLGIVLDMAQVKFFEAYLLPVWGMAWMQKSITLEDYNACNFSAFGECKPDTMTIDWQTTGTGGLVVVLLILVAAMWTIRNRDVT
jgi:ABC-type transport system involved in multi-copper enzyme maturation permease subunit